MLPANVLRVLLDGPVTDPAAGAGVVDGRICLSSKSVRNCCTIPANWGMDTVSSIFVLAAPQIK